MIVNKKMKGTATTKDEIFGNFRPGGISSNLRFKDFLYENNKIRIDNGQNKFFVYLIFLIRVIKNIKSFISG